MIHTDQQSDRVAFRTVMKDLCEYYDKTELSNGVLLMYFNSLGPFSIGEVKAAANRHISSPDYGAFMPKIGCLIRQLDGATANPDMIIAAAKLKRTPLGVLARIHIGTWDLDNLGGFDLRQRAIECQDLMGEWRQRASSGEYTDHEISIMIKHGVDPSGPFTSGIAGPADKSALSARIARLAGDARHEFLLGNESERPGDESVDLEQQRIIFKKIREAMNKPNTDMSEPNGN